MQPKYVALIAEDGKTGLDDLTACAAALQKQVTNDFGPIWNLTAVVSAFASLETMPHDYWPVILRDTIDEDLLGFHRDKHGQPYALVESDAGWQQTASHELLEMLCDPFNSAMIGGPSPVAGQGMVQFVVEVCDPCGDAGYVIDGITVSDFCTPAYYKPYPAERYSFTQAVKTPLDVLRNGYLSWHLQPGGQIWQRQWFGGGAPVNVSAMAAPTNGMGFRAAIDNQTARLRRAAQPARAKKKRIAKHRPASAAIARARSLRAEFENPLK